MLQLNTLIVVCFIFAINIAFGDYYKETFTKKCARCHMISHEVQMYAYNEWTGNWVISWRSDINRPDICENCYFELQPKPRFLDSPKDSYRVHTAEPNGPNNGNPQLLHEHERWWNNGYREIRSKARPLGLGWRLGRLNY